MILSGVSLRVHPFAALETATDFQTARIAFVINELRISEITGTDQTVSGTRAATLDCVVVVVGRTEFFA
jgi:hypothetical protein